MTAINNGAVFFNYVGHAGPDSTLLFRTASILSISRYDPPSDDVSALRNANGLPIMTAMTCVLGNFSNPYEVY